MIHASTLANIPEAAMGRPQHLDITMVTKANGGSGRITMDLISSPMEEIFTHAKSPLSHGHG